MITVILHLLSIVVGALLVLIAHGRRKDGRTFVLPLVLGAFLVLSAILNLSLPA